MKKNIYILFLIILIVAIILIANLYFSNGKVVAPVVPVVSENNCAKDGETVGSCVNCMTKCCSGLKALESLKYGGKCVSMPAPGSVTICTSKCGNGVCDEQSRENECNCPQDCK